MKTIIEIMSDDRYEMAKTYIVKCLGTTEIYTSVNKLIRDWGLEEATAFMLNTRELIINVA